MKDSQPLIVTAAFASVVIFASCVGDSPGGNDREPDSPTDDASSSGSAPPVTGGSTSSSSSSSGGSGSSGVVDAGGDAIVEAGPDPRCTGPVAIEGAGDNTVACASKAYFPPFDEFVLGAYDLTTAIGGGFGSGTCSNDLWRGTLEVAPTADGFVMHLSTSAGVAHADYTFLAKKLTDSVYSVQSLCGSGLPFPDISADAGAEPQTESLFVQKPSDGPRTVSFTLARPDGAPGKIDASFIQR